jgi:hypothetical protein
MFRNLALVTLCSGSAAVLGTICFLAISGRTIPDSLTQTNSALSSGLLGFVSPGVIQAAGAVAGSVGAAVGSAALLDRNKEGGEN